MSCLRAELFVDQSCIIGLPPHLSPLDVAVPKKYKKLNGETVLCSHCLRQNRSEGQGSLRLQ
jgi:hypothetical protein